MNQTLDITTGGAASSVEARRSRSRRRSPGRPASSRPMHSHVHDEAQSPRAVLNSKEEVSGAAEAFDATSFTAFYSRTYRRMRGLAYVLTQSMNDVDDILQDAYRALLNRWDSADMRCPEAYLRTIVVNRSSRYRRGAAVDRERSTQRQQWHRSEELSANAEPFDDTTANRTALRQALVLLSTDQRTAIVLRYLEDLPVRQVALTMSTPERPVAEATVRSWVRRGLQHLHAELAA